MKRYRACFSLLDYQNPVDTIFDGHPTMYIPVEALQVNGYSYKCFTEASLRFHQGKPYFRFLELIPELQVCMRSAPFCDLAKMVMVHLGGM